MQIKIKGEYSFTRVRNNNDLRRYGTGVTLDVLRRWGLETDQVWIVNEPLGVKIIEHRHDGSSYGHHYQFDVSFLTDLASVPKKLRGLVDNDDLRLIAPSLVHDYNFVTHAMSFVDSNRLFYRMIRALGGSWWTATKAWLAVASPFGWHCYKNYSYDRAKYYESNCHHFDFIEGF